MTKLNQTNQISKCLITGGNGYLGKHISESLTAQNYDVHSLGISEHNHYSFDISVGIPSLKDEFEVVVHCAGKAHSFPRTVEEEAAFYQVNVKGTENLLKALEQAPRLPKSFVFLSSVSVYGLNEGLSVSEDAPLLSKYPYGLSKIKAEQLIRNWCEERHISCLILRLPLLAGKNPPGNLKLMIDGIKQGYYFNITKEVVRKSIVMAADVARMIPSSLQVGGTYNLTDGYHPSFQEIADLIADQLGKRRPRSLPWWLYRLVKILANKLKFISPVNAYKFEKLSSTLTFDDSKARKTLGWNPEKVLDKFEIE